MHEMLKRIVGLCEHIATERIGLDDVGTRLQILHVDGADHVGTCEDQEVVVPFQRTWVIGKAITSKVSFLQRVALDHGAHGTVKDKNAFGKELSDIDHSSQNYDSMHHHRC